MIEHAKGALVVPSQGTRKPVATAHLQKGFHMITALKAVIAAVGIALAVAIANIGFENYRTLQDRVVTVEAQLTTTREELLGYSKYTDYIAKGKQSLQGDAHLLTTTLNENVKWVEHIERKVLFFKSTGTVLLNLNIEYAFGFDLRPDKYEVVATKGGLEIRIGKPMSVARPSVRMTSWDIVSGSVFIDEKKAGLDLLTRVQPVFDSEARTYSHSEKVKALCEKRLVEHLSGFLEKQPGVRFVPRITVAYR